MAKRIDITGKALSGEWGVDDDTGDGIPVLRTTNFTNEGTVNFSNVVTRKINKKDLSKKYLRKGDIIIEKSGGSDKQPVGRVIFFDGDENKYLFNNFTGLLRVSDQSKWLPKYVFYALFSNYIQGGTRPFENKTTGLHNLKTDSYVESFEIKAIPLGEQRITVNQLDRVNELISLRKQQLARLDELVKARFVELFGDTILNPFGWKKDLLGRVCDVRDGTHDSPQYYESGYPLVTSKNVTGGKIDLTDCSLICEADFKKINERSKVDIGDIIMPMIGTVGKPVIVDIEPNFAIKNVSLIKFKADSRVLNTYIRALLQSDYFDDAVLSKVRGGTQKFISLGDIRKLEVLVPPMELQEQFATFIKQTDKSKLAIQQSLDKLETLKRSLMQKYFG